MRTLRKIAWILLIGRVVFLAAQFVRPAQLAAPVEVREILERRCGENCGSQGMKFARLP